MHTNSNSLFHCDATKLLSSYAFSLPIDSATFDVTAAVAVLGMV